MTSQIARWIVCPALLELMAGHRRILAGSLVEFGQLIARSNPPLVNLHLSYCFEDAQNDPLEDHTRALESLLRTLPTLKRLHLDGAVLDDQMIKGMTLGQTQGSHESTICPSLSEIVIICSESVTEDILKPRVVADMIVSRWKHPENPTNNLEKVDLRLLVPDLQETLETNEALEDCVREGLQLRFPTRLGDVHGDVWIL